MYFLKYVFWIISNPPKKATDCSFKYHVTEDWSNCCNQKKIIIKIESSYFKL